MIDIKWIRENELEFNALMQKRGVSIDSNLLLLLDEEKRRCITLVQELQQAKNIKSKALAKIGNPTSKEFDDIRRDVEHINERIVELNKEMGISGRIQDILDNIPNPPAEDVPYGTDESMNKLIRTVGDVNHTPHRSKEHCEIGVDLGMMDFEQTAKISGSRFVTLKRDLAQLQRAIISFMIDIHTANGFEEIAPPVLVKHEAMYNVGQLPKFDEDSYSTLDGRFKLIPTGEVPLTNMVANSILKREELPIRYVAYTECFRSEAGSAGRDTRGMIRNHQFGKVELVTITTPRESELEHEKMLESAEEVLKKLQIPYRIMLLCTGDMGFAARKTYDIEVWLPGQNKYREISSISNCGDFQARRMKARYKEFAAVHTSFVHTLNGSGLAVGRTLVAILENYQNSDNSVVIPDALIPYMQGKTVIEP